MSSPNLRSETWKSITQTSKLKNIILKLIFLSFIFVFVYLFREGRTVFCLKATECNLYTETFFVFCFSWSPVYTGGEILSFWLCIRISGQKPGANLENPILFLLFAMFSHLVLSFCPQLFFVLFLPAPVARGSKMCRLRLVISLDNIFDGLLRCLVLTARHPT